MRKSYLRSMLSLGVLCFWASAAVAERDPAEPLSGPNEVIKNAGRAGTTITFESLNLPAGSQIDPPAGEPMTVDGFTFTPGPNNASGFNDSHYGNAVTGWCYNGTHVMLHHDDVVMTKDGGGTFDLVSLDFAGFPTNFEIDLTVTGQPGNVIAVIDPDGNVNGPTPPDDFQNFVLPPGFTNLTSVTFEHSGGGTNAGLFGLDNILVSKPVSVDEKSWGVVKEAYR